MGNLESATAVCVGSQFLAYSPIPGAAGGVLGDGFGRVLFFPAWCLEFALFAPDGGGFTVETTPN